MFDLCYIIQTMKETYLTADQITRAFLMMLLRRSNSRVSLFQIRQNKIQIVIMIPCRHYSDDNKDADADVHVDVYLY